MSSTQPILSFCITCLNRFHQLSQTLPYNLKKNTTYEPRLEFVLVNFIDQTQNDVNGHRVHKWISERYQRAIRRGYLRYAVTNQLPTWHASVAKNTSHHLAQGKFLINLDGDNYVNFLEVQELLKRDKILQKCLYHGFSNQWHDGTYGRIGMSRQAFTKIGGYDESFLPMGGQDMDLLIRLQHQFPNYRLLKNKHPIKALHNTKKESLQYINSNLTVENSEESSHQRWKQMEKKNRQSLNQKIRRKNYCQSLQTGVPVHLVTNFNISLEEMLATLTSEKIP